ncbi:TonB-dependent receptor [Fulvivirga ulvae]|uniref:TonB-dependent receptor n=1 Tax=Fulvivirga ulvae TaxID=2904245 RepID=UPI001F3341F5|nr:TonB-dependent receptor [Fulvivirga ulvae]UII32940.1 TonB-dependent receptor [Fulvivirga ulvae]
MRITLITFLTINCLNISSVFAQQKLKVLDSESSMPVEGATIVVSTTSAPARSSMLISDSKGVVSISETTKSSYIISINHINYKPFADTLQLESNQTITLQPTVVQLNELVVTGQYEPQSVRNTVYKVRTINKGRIEKQGATNLQHVLNNELNIRFSRDNATGTSGMSLQGISGQNVKVLLDGIPLTGRSGTANEIDINQINVSTIEKIEIVEGPMSVNYGADALAGVINIITKKHAPHKLTANLQLHEETVGSEYSLFSEGIHTPAIDLGYNINSSWYTQLYARINKFGGWTGDGTERDKSWYPKNQYFTGALARFSNDDLDIFYKVDYLNELLENLGPVNDNNPLKDAFALDEEYEANRWIHQLQAEFAVGKGLFNSAVSYSDYKRSTYQFIKNLVTDDEDMTSADEQDEIYYKTFFTRNTWNNGLKWQWGTSQLGMDMNYEFAGGTTLNEGEKSLKDIGLFASAELVVGKSLKIRPGIRYAYNSVYEAPVTPSLNLRYGISSNTTLRLGYGRGFRAPSLRELYHEFIDANHNILGNEDLEAEHSNNLNMDINHILTSGKNFFNLSLSAFFNDIDNRITYFTPSGINQPTTYTNISRYKTLGLQWQGQWKTKSLLVNLGYNHTGRYQSLNELSDTDVPQFLYSPELNANVSYSFEKPGITLACFYKYTGKRENYTLTTQDDGTTKPELLKMDGFQWLDFTVNKDFGKGLTATTGVRNALDITSVNNNYPTDAHNSSANGQSPVSYGRSYFLQLNYTIKTNDK